MLPFPIKIEDCDESLNQEKRLPSLQSPYMIRLSNSFKLLGLSKLTDKKAHDNSDEFQCLQINYKTIQIQIRCHKKQLMEYIMEIYKRKYILI